MHFCKNVYNTFYFFVKLGKHNTKILSLVQYHLECDIIFIIIDGILALNNPQFQFYN